MIKQPLPLKLNIPIYACCNVWGILQGFLILVGRGYLSVSHLGKVVLGCFEHTSLHAGQPPK